MSELSTLVDNRVATASAVISSANVNRDLVTRRVAQVTTLSEPDVRSVIDALVDSLQKRTSDMRTREQELQAEKLDDLEIREERDRITATLVDAVVGAKSMLRGAFGDRRVSEFGLAGETPRTPREVAEYVAGAISLIESASRDPGRFGTVLDVDRLVDVLRKPLVKLEKKLTTLDGEIREREAVMLKRDEAVEKWSQTYQGAATTLEGLYKLAGESELAARIRPTIRRASGIVAGDVEDEHGGIEDDGAAPADDADGPQDA